MSDDEFMVDDDEEYDLVGIVHLNSVSSLNICFASLFCSLSWLIPAYSGSNVVTQC